MSKLEARRHTLQSVSTKEQEQLKLWEAQYTEKQRDEERLAGHLRLLDEQLKTARRELDEHLCVLANWKLPEKAKNNNCAF